jgi:alpha-D-ribose 1-methylphosphonate 5-triphosphate synthase subunit PhnL
MTTLTEPVIELSGVAKTFTLHQQQGTELPVLAGVNLLVAPGECLVLDGPSGQGKSTLLKLIYANYLASAGHIVLRVPGAPALDVGSAEPRELVQMRRDSVGYVSQFLRVIPRVPALDVVAEPLLQSGMDEAVARERAAEWLSRLRIPQALWGLPPATFSGGEQQRVNIARNMIRRRALLLLDEPTASLDAHNTETVIALIREALVEGTAVIGIFHDRAVGEAVATRHLDVTHYRKPA